MSAFRWATSARNAGVELNVGNLAMFAVSPASCWRNGVLASRRVLRSVSLTPMPDANETAESGTSSAFISARADATVWSAEASAAATRAFWRADHALVVEDEMRIAA